MRIIWEGKHQISNPDSFTDKIRRVEKRDAKKALETSGLKRVGSSSSLGSSMYSKSQMTGISLDSSENGEKGEGDQEDGEHDDDNAT